jgi:nucleoside-diphosphate-sugar epimerase
MKVLIAGGTGFIGQRLTQSALRKGWDVHLMTRNPTSADAAKMAQIGASLIVGDITDAKRTLEVFTQVRPTHYFHNAGWYELGIPASKHERMWSINVGGLVNALDAAERLQVEKLVVTSSTTALGDTGGEIVDENFERSSPTFSWYEHCLYEAYQVLAARINAGLPIVLGSPAQVIGPGDHSVFGIMLRLFLQRLLPPTLWGPEGAFSFVHVEDVASGLIRMMEDGRIGENYFLAGSIMTNREMVAFWRKQTGRFFPTIWIPRSMAMLVGYLAEPLLRTFGQPAFISPEVVRSSYVSYRYSDEKVRKELGVTVRTAREAWADTVAVEKG